MFYSRFARFLNDHRFLQLVLLWVSWLINYYGIFWLVYWVNPEWANETFDMWLGLACMVGSALGIFSLKRCWRIQDELRDLWGRLTPHGN